MFLINHAHIPIVVREYAKSFLSASTDSFKKNIQATGKLRFSCYRRSKCEKL